jgi:hypothetical protein
LPNSVSDRMGLTAVRRGPPETTAWMTPVSRAERPSLRHAPGLFETLKDDVCHVGADLTKRGWRREFGASFSGLEAFDLSDTDQARLHDVSSLHKAVECRAI